jgi:CBS domain-containing protein
MDVAARIMWDADCGIVPVVGDEDRLVGVITDRDACMASLTRGLPLTALKVGEAMSRAPKACAPHDTVETVEAAMAEHRIRRLPVVESGRVVGIVSLNDLARAAASQPRAITSERLIGTLATICEPRTATARARVATATAG